MMFEFLRKKNKKDTIPQNSVEYPYKYRFTFVPKGEAFFAGVTVHISKKIARKEHAFFIASEIFRRDYPHKAKGSVAVFFGDVEASDCDDVLYGAYHSF